MAISANAIPVEASERLDVQLFTAPDAQGIAAPVAAGSVVRANAALRLRITSAVDGLMSVQEWKGASQTLLVENIAIKAGSVLWYPAQGGLHSSATNGAVEWRVRVKPKAVAGTAVEGSISFWVASPLPASSPLPTKQSEIRGSVGSVLTPSLNSACLAINAPRVQSLRSSALYLGDENTRGAKEAALFREFSPAVVLIVAGQGLGSGWVVDKERRLILTNFHVVEAAADQLAVIFKPKHGDHATAAEAVKAQVVRVDQVADLALVQVAVLPDDIPVLALGSIADLEIGADVHAIGHPEGEQWSYTKGIVSQVRRDYEWGGEGTIKHNATVIQTQTPINPGNSGGPLLDDQGRVIGINSFIRRDAQGMSYAVSVDDIRNFLSRSDSRYAAGHDPDSLAAAAPADKSAPGDKGANSIPPQARRLPESGKSQQSCDPSQRAHDRNGDGQADAWVLDVNCDGQEETLALDTDGDGWPDELYVDRNNDGKPDVHVLDRDRDGRFDLWLIDQDGDGRPDTTGFDRDGDGEPDTYQAANG